MARPPPWQTTSGNRIACARNFATASRVKDSSEWKDGGAKGFNAAPSSQRQCDDDFGATIESGLDSDSAVMCFQDAANDGQAEAPAFALGAA